MTQPDPQATDGREDAATPATASQGDPLLDAAQGRGGDDASRHGADADGTTAAPEVSEEA